MKKLVAFLFALLIVAAVPAIAEVPSNYVSLKLGGYFPQSSDLEDFNNGFNVEAAFGRNLSPHFALEFGIGYFKTDFDVADFDPMIGSITENDEITVYPVTVNAKLIHNVGKAEIFGGVGLGAYFTKAESTITIGGSTASDSDTDTAIGFNISAGANYNISTNAFIGAEIKYLWAKANFEGTFFGIPVALDAKLDGISATANVGYRF